MAAFENYLQRAIDALKAGSGDLFSETVHDAHDHTGIPGVGEGGGFSDTFQSAFDGTQTHLTNNTSTAFLLNPSLVAPGFLSRAQGTALSWGGAGNKSRIVCNTTGYYDMHGVLLMTKGTEEFYFGMGVSVNGSAVRHAVGPTIIVPSTATGGNNAGTTVDLLSYPLTASDYVEFTGIQVGNTTEDNTVPLAIVTVRRVA